MVGPFSIWSWQQESYLYPLYGGIMLLAALMVGCTCVILEELRNPGQDKKGE